MRNVICSKLAVAVRIVRNTRAASSNSHWAKIVEVCTGKTLHIGQLSYIRRIARERFNVKAEI